MLTPSRFFNISNNTSKSLEIVGLKDPTGNYYTPIQHPAILAYENMSSKDRLDASTEFLEAKNSNFWNSVPEISAESINSLVQVRTDFPKILKSDWIRLIKLYAFECETQRAELEVGALISYHRKTHTTRILVPEQTVTKASVDWAISSSKTLKFLDGTDLPYEEYKAEWDFLGMTHSHNTMFTSPSSVDDTFEVGTPAKPLPTGVHILVGSFSSYSMYEEIQPNFEVYPSVSHAGRRYKVGNLSELVELDISEKDWVTYTFDESVLSLIHTIKTYSHNTYQKPSYGTPKYSFGMTKIKKKVEALKDLSAIYPTDNTREFLATQAYDVLEELLGILATDLGEDTLNILDVVESNLDFVPEKSNSVDLGFPLGFEDPFFVGDSNNGYS